MILEIDWYTRKTRKIKLLTLPIKCKNVTIDKFKCTTDTKFFAFIDMEMHGCLRSKKSRIQIPSVYQFCILVTDEKFNEIMCTNTKTVDIDAIIDVHKKYNPIFIAHNGYNFDFKVIFSYALHNGKIDLFKNMKFYDSLHFARVNFLYLDKIKPENYCNSTLFKYFLQNYISDANLIHNAHNAHSDCLMLKLWFSALHELKPYDFKYVLGSILYKNYTTKK